MWVGVTRVLSNLPMLKLDARAMVMWPDDFIKLCIYFYIKLLCIVVIFVGRGGARGAVCTLLEWMSFVVLTSESLLVFILCIWRFEHARFCVKVFFIRHIYVFIHSFIQSCLYPYTKVTPNDLTGLALDLGYQRDVTPWLFHGSDPLCLSPSILPSRIIQLRFPVSSSGTTRRVMSICFALVRTSHFAWH